MNRRSTKMVSLGDELQAAMADKVKIEIVDGVTIAAAEAALTRGDVEELRTLRRALAARSQAIAASLAKPGSGNAAWRPRALAAMKHTDNWIARVDARLAEIRPAPRRERVVRVLKDVDSAEDLADRIRKMTDIALVQAMVMVDDDVVLVALATIEE